MKPNKVTGLNFHLSQIIVKSSTRLRVPRGDKNLKFLTLEQNEQIFFVSVYIQKTRNLAQFGYATLVVTKKMKLLTTIAIH